MHTHTHPHDAEHETQYTREEGLALLRYMAEHNRHHTDELHELAHQVGGDVEALIHEACVDYAAGNEKLEQAVRLLEEA